MSEKVFPRDHYDSDYHLNNMPTGRQHRDLGKEVAQRERAVALVRKKSRPEGFAGPSNLPADPKPRTHR